jgi:hypothetical protein
MAARNGRLTHFSNARGKVNLVSGLANLVRIGNCRFLRLLTNLALTMLEVLPLL